MTQRIKNQYNSLYATAEYVFGGGKPVDAVVVLSKYLKPGSSVLDIGGGEGRNALYLAKQGFAVTVTDISEVGIEKLKTVAQKKGLSIDTQIADVVTNEPEGMYDCIIISFVLHHMDTHDAVRIIEQTQKHTNSGGVHVLSTFMDRGDLYERNKSTERFYPSEALVRKLYKHWTIKVLTTQEVQTHARNKKGERMHNHVVTITAIKK